MSSFAEFLSGILGAIFENILSPLLTEFFKFVVYTVIDIIKDAFAWLFYYGFTTLLSCIRVMSDLFEFFAGTTRGNVIVEGQQTTVLQALFEFDAVKQMFGLFTVIGMFLALMFSIIATMRSMSDMTLDNKNPISKVITNAMKAFITFAIIPILCLFLMQLSTIIVTAIDSGSKAIANTNADNIDEILWLNCSMDAAKNESWNVSKASDENREKIMRGDDAVRKPYLTGTKSYMYVDGEAENDFELGKFDYVQGYVSSILVILMLAGSIMVFIARLFELLVLYIVGPIFAASIANDGGEMFKQWKDMFIAKFFAGYTMVFGMRLYLLIVPVICGSSISFESATQATGQEYAAFKSIIQIFIVLGGAYAVYKSQTMIIRLLSVEASMQAQDVAGAGVGVMSMGMGAAKVLAKASYNNIKGKKGDKGDLKELKEKKDEGGSSDSGNAYKGGNPTGS